MAAEPMQNKTTTMAQRGAATLLPVTLMLFAITAVVFIGANIGVIDQQTSANDYRARQASVVAQAGIEEALARLWKIDVNATPTNANWLTRQLQYTDDAGNAHTIGEFTVGYDAGGDPNSIVITSVGRSADASATLTVTQTANYAPVLRYDAGAPLVAKGSATTTGSVRLENAATDVALWSGGAVSGSPTVSSSVSSSVAVIDNDPLLDDPNEVDFFSNFMGTSKDNIRSLAKRVDCSSTCSGSEVATKFSQDGTLYWVEGTLNITTGVTLGTQNAPVVIVVNGSDKFHLNSPGATINGVVYVIGDWNNGNGRGTINGAAVVEGNFSASPSANYLNLTYNQTVFDNLADRVGPYVKIPGSWREM